MSPVQEQESAVHSAAKVEQNATDARNDTPFARERSTGIVIILVEHWDRSRRSSRRLLNQGISSWLDPASVFCLCAGVLFIIVVITIRSAYILCRMICAEPLE